MLVARPFLLGYTQFPVADANFLTWWGGGGANLQLLPFFFEHLHSPHVGLPRPPAQH